MKATDVLRSEHETILDVLAALESIGQPQAAGGELDVRSAREALEFLQCFGDLCHHGKEERHLFPALAACGFPAEGGPLAVMRAEHDEGRALLARMAGALAGAGPVPPDAAAEFRSAALAYVALMRDHIAKENGVLFPMADGMLSAVEQARLLHAFEAFEHGDMEAGAHERFLSIAGGLRARLRVQRTRATTAAHACCGRGTRCS